MTKSETTATASNNSEDTLGKAFSITKEEQEFLELARGLEGGDTANFSKEFLNFILDITSDSDDIFSTKDDPKERKAHPKQRLDFLKILFLVLGLCTPDVQAEYLHTFNYKLKIAGLKVQAELSRRGGVAKVLDVLHVSSELSGTVLKEVLQLLSVLLSFDVNVHELKRILALMMGTDNPNKIASKPYFWDGLLSLLSGVSAEMRPQNYFYLSGINSGFKLPDIRFPSGGYTLSFWIRFESFSCRTTKDPMCSPCIATFGSLTGQHLSIFIRDSCVVIQHQIAPSKVETVVFKTAQLSTRKWYMLTLSHVSRIIRRSEISLYLDGVLAESNSLSYPKSDVNFCDSCIAASPARTDAQMLKVGPLWCQLGKVMLLCDALDANEVSLLYKVGPNATIKTDSVGQVDGTYMFARKAVKLLFAYHPNGFCKGVCVDIASGLSSPVSQQGVHVDRSAKAFEGVKVFHTTPLHLALLNAGGIKVPSVHTSPHIVHFLKLFLPFCLYSCFFRFSGK